MWRRILKILGTKKVPGCVAVRAEEGISCLAESPEQFAAKLERIVAIEREKEQRIGRHDEDVSREKDVS